MKTSYVLASACAAAGCMLISGFAAAQDTPGSFDLRSVRNSNYVSTVKSQNGGTCWTHGTMASIESNLMMTGVWFANGEQGEPNLAEYHMDWWNGFNRHLNQDISPRRGGLTVHEGGDYLIAAAYIARGEGVVRDVDGQSYSRAPAQFNSSYHTYYARDVEWMSAGSDLSGLDQIKKSIMTGGVIGTALAWSDSFYSSSRNSFYQPRTSSMEANHAVAIVGWDDMRQTQASKPGAWLVKNSWGSSWGNRGYFWISYYDKVTTQHPDMGAVAFRNVEPMQYQKVYYHDYHGWRGTKNVIEAFNAFVAEGKDNGRELLKAVSFYTTADNADYTVKVYGSFVDGQLGDELAVISGTIDTMGFHTRDLTEAVELEAGQKFYIYVSVSKGGQAYDKTSNVPVLLGSDAKVIVESTARPGESFYMQDDRWVDLTTDDRSANFAIKALSIYE